jgi:hypothetical protein
MQKKCEFKCDDFTPPTLLKTETTTTFRPSQLFVHLYHSGLYSAKLAAIGLISGSILGLATVTAVPAFTILSAGFVGGFIIYLINKVLANIQDPMRKNNSDAMPEIWWQMRDVINILAASCVGAFVLGYAVIPVLYCSVIGLIVQGLIKLCLDPIQTIGNVANLNINNRTLRKTYSQFTDQPLGFAAARLPNFIIPGF